MSQSVIRFAIRFQCLLVAMLGTRVDRSRDERGAAAVEWLLVVGAGAAIAYFAGDSVMAFAKSIAAKLDP